ncbi:hypothetical protein QBZ16_004460 [Prototheca wickerhamii]|uniref:Uncharacterized protein n=1 Tax=Prototheca wickerhamii TaxID=3111 RepID=A0AAD9IJ71_PROWI|nr:hypothetical protein QBZ16_004460 [Prototheca wickerhamii]
MPTRFAWTLLLASTLLLLATASEVEDASSSEAYLPDRQYRRAIAIRDDPESTPAQLESAVNLLMAAAGIESISLGRAEAPARVLTARDVRVVTAANASQHQEALRELAALYLEGSAGVPFLPAVSDALLRRLAAGGLPEAQADLAMHLALGVELAAPGGGNPDRALFALRRPSPGEALALYGLAAGAGDGAAQAALGFRHLHGLGVPRDCAAAALHYGAAALGVVRAAAAPGGLAPQHRLRLGIGAPPVSQQLARYDPLQEVLHYQWFADFGHAEAARAVAVALGAEGDPRAVDYLRQAAAAGDVEAQARLGHAFVGGIGVAADNATALSWFKKAAEKGHPSALLGLGLMHLEGRGVPRSYEKAYLALRQAAETSVAMGGWSGVGEVYFYLGKLLAGGWLGAGPSILMIGTKRLLHLRGWGVSADVSRAAANWELGSRQGHVLASYNLALLHLGNHTSARRPCAAGVALLKRVVERGWATEQEAHEDWIAGADDWALLGYLKAAEMGFRDAALNAAWLLRRGRGFADEAGVAPALALALLRRAAAQGSVSARRELGDAAWYGRGARAATPPRPRGATWRPAPSATRRACSTSRCCTPWARACRATRPSRGATSTPRAWPGRARPARPSRSRWPACARRSSGSARSRARLPAAWAAAVGRLASRWARAQLEGMGEADASKEEEDFKEPPPVLALYEAASEDEHSDGRSDEHSKAGAAGLPSQSSPHSSRQRPLGWLEAIDMAILSMTDLEIAVMLLLIIVLGGCVALLARWRAARLPVPPGRPRPAF